MVEMFKLSEEEIAAAFDRAVTGPHTRFDQCTPFRQTHELAFAREIAAEVFLKTGRLVAEQCHDAAAGADSMPLAMSALYQIVKRFPAIKPPEKPWRTSRVDAAGFEWQCRAGKLWFRRAGSTEEWVFSIWEMSSLVENRVKSGALDDAMILLDIANTPR